MFVRLQKYAKQCCDATVLDCTHCSGQQTMGTVDDDVTRYFLFGDKHQNLIISVSVSKYK